MLSYDEASIKTTRSFYRHTDGEVLTFNIPQELHHLRIVGSTDGWLVLADLTPALRLYNPLTRSNIDLPPLTTLPMIVSYNKEKGDCGEYLIESKRERYKVGSELVRDICLQKMVTSCEDNGRMVVAMIFEDRTLAFARVGEDDNWTPVEECSCVIEDVLFCRGRLYAMTGLYLMAIDINNKGYNCVKMRLSIPLIDKLPPFSWYLVEVAGDLLVVQTHLNNPIHVTRNFEVFRLEENFDLIGKLEHQLTKVETLGDWMLFLGSSHSMSFNAKGHPRWKGNCIYFTLNLFSRFRYRIYSDSICNSYLGEDHGVFNLKDARFESLLHGRQELLWPAPIWFTPNLRPFDNHHTRIGGTKRKLEDTRTGNEKKKTRQFVADSFELHSEGTGMTAADANALPLAKERLFSVKRKN